jgi:hypothetical protein
MRRLLSTLILTLCIKTLVASSSPFLTLRDLITDSQYIVIATIDNPIKPSRKQYDSYRKDTVLLWTFNGDGQADLYIKEVLKGSPDNNEHIIVEVENMYEGPYYRDKKTVIAFLTKDDTSKTYRTYGLAYGVMEIEGDEKLNSYKTKISDYIEILKIKNKKERETATVEWLVKCAEDKYLNYVGSFGLSSKEYLTSFFTQNVFDPHYLDDYNDGGFYKMLSVSQIQRITSSFFMADTLDNYDLCLANHIHKDNYPKLKTKLLDNLVYSDYRIARQIMYKVIDIAPNSDLQKIYEELNRLDYFDTDRQAKQKLIIDKFIATAARQ